MAAKNDYYSFLCDNKGIGGSAGVMSARDPGEHSCGRREDGCGNPEGSSEALTPMLDRLLHIQTQSPLNPYPHIWSEESEVTPSKVASRRRQKGRLSWIVFSALAWYARTPVWWLTLTSSEGQRDINLSWNALRVRIGRTTRWDIVRWLSDTTRPDYSFKESRYLLEKYEGLDLDELVDFEFIAIKTSEGNGVYHCFVFGDALPSTWLRYWWDKYHHSRQIKIELVKRTKSSTDKVRRYALRQYALGQDQFVRMSHSRNILFPNQRKTFIAIIKAVGYDNALIWWRYCMLVQGIPLIDSTLPSFAPPPPGVRYVRLSEALEYNDKYGGRF